MTRKLIIRIFLCVFLILCAIMCYILIIKLPMQELQITAQTTADKFDLSGSTRLYYFDKTEAGMSHSAAIKFMAVPNTSENLFTHFGTGQYVYLGCSELQAEYSFISFGRFITIRLTLNAAETDLKLEDGTPFDVTRYSLKPILMIEE